MIQYINDDLLGRRMYNQMADLSSYIKFYHIRRSDGSTTSDERVKQIVKKWRATMRANALMMAALDYRKKWIERHSDYTND